MGAIPEKGVKTYYFARFFFAKKCMKIKEIGPGGACVPSAPLDPPMLYCLHSKTFAFVCRVNKEKEHLFIGNAVKRCHSKSFIFHSVIRNVWSFSTKDTWRNFLNNIPLLV